MSDTTQRTLDMLREEWTKPYREALEQFADPLMWPPSLREKPYVVHMRGEMRKALDRASS